MGLLDEIKPTPRRGLLGEIADLVAEADRFARKPFGYDNPPAGLLSDVLGVPGLARTLDRLSYGEPITNIGKGSYKPLIPPDTADAAGLLGPMAYGGAKKLGGLLSDPRLARAVANAAAPKYVSPAARSLAGGSQRGAITMGQDDLQRAIAEVVNGSAAADRSIGLRVLPPDQANARVGEALAPSFRWVDGAPTDEVLSGVSTVWLRDGSPSQIADAIRAAGIYKNGPNGYYRGPKIAIVGGSRHAAGEDQLEAVIDDAVVRAIFDNPRWK